MSKFLQILVLAKDKKDIMTCGSWPIFDTVETLQEIINEYNSLEIKDNPHLNKIREYPEFKDIVFPICVICDYSLYSFHSLGLDKVEEDQNNIMGISIIDNLLLDFYTDSIFPTSRKPETLGEYAVCAMMYASEFGFEYGCFVYNGTEKLGTMHLIPTPIKKRLNIVDSINNKKNLFQFFVNITRNYIMAKDFDEYFAETETFINQRFDYDDNVN